MNKRIIALLTVIGLLPMALLAIQEFDTQKSIDLSGRTSVTGSQLNQLVDTGVIGATNKGAVIRQATTPDTANNPRYTNFLWIDTSAGIPGTLKQWNGSGWSSGTIGIGGIASSNLADSSVVSGKIALNGVNTSNIVNGAITDVKIAAGALNYSHYQAQSISNSSIALLTILGGVNGNIAYGTITSTNIADGTITGSKLASSTITSNNIAPSNITSTVIAPTAVTESKIADNGVSTRTITNGAVTPDKIVSGFVGRTVQYVWTNVTSYGTSTLNIPYDDTVPQSGEGTNIFSVPFAPVSTTNLVIVRATVVASCNAAAYLTLSLFHTTVGTSAIAASTDYTTGANLTRTLKLTHVMPASTLASGSFNINLGGETGSVYLNGSGAARKFGGVAMSTLEIEEVRP